MFSRMFVCLVLAAILFTEGQCCEEGEISESSPLQGAVEAAFNDQLRQQVMESCVKHTEDMLAAAKSNVLNNVKPFSEACAEETHACPKSEEYFDVMNTGRKEWRMAFRGTPGINKSVFDVYKDGLAGVNIEIGCKQITSTAPCTNHYRNDEVLNKWQGIDEVAFVLFVGGAKVKHIIFDATGTTYMDWLQKSKVKSSSWTDLTTESSNFFSIAGDGGLRRRFYLSRNHAGCPNDNGWFVAVDRTNVPCSWEANTAYPIFLFSKNDTFQNWTSGSIGKADVMAVFVKYQS